MSKRPINISPTDRYTYSLLTTVPKRGDGIKNAIIGFLIKWPTATPEQIANQLGIQPELVERIIEADKKRKLEGF